MAKGTNGSGALGALIRRVTPDERLAKLGVRPELRVVAVKMATTFRSEPTIRELQDYLAVEEIVEVMMEGRYAKVLGVLALTDRRVLFVANESATAGPRLSVARGGLAITAPKKSAVRLVGPGTDALIDHALGRSGEIFAETATTGPQEKPADPLVRLAQLRDDRDAGRISNADFEAAKNRLLTDL